METKINDDLKIVSPGNKQTFIHVDGTPDADYPIRILEAYLDESHVVGSGGAEILAKMMNETQAERNKLIRAAIQKLRGS